MNINTEKTEEYIRSKSLLLDELSSIHEYAKENHVPIIQDEVANFLRTQIYLKKPNRLLEIGTAIGYSSIFFAKCYENLEIISIERNLKSVEIAKQNIEKFGLSDRIKVYYGDAEEIIPSLEGNFQMLFLDANKSKYGQFLKLSERLLEKNALVIADNILFKGMVVDDSLVPRRDRTITRNLRNFLDDLISNKNYITSLLPLGDGVSISIYLGEKNE